MADRLEKQDLIGSMISCGICKSGKAESAYEGGGTVNYKLWWYYTHVDDYEDCNDYDYGDVMVSKAIPARKVICRLPEDEEYVITPARSDVVEEAAAWDEDVVLQPAVHIVADLTQFATALTTWQEMI